jgi:electron transfer flavoprotein beta subunit
VKRSADELGIPRVISPLDRHALEEALRIKDSRGGRVTVLSMDTPAAWEVLRETLALGADRAILLSHPALAGADTLATARCLAAAIKRLGEFDLILCGAWSYHGNTGQVGPQVAELLGIAHVSFATKLEFVAPDRLRARSEWNGNYVIVEAGLPLLVTVTESINIPRHVSLMGIVRARDREVLQWGLENLGLSPEQVGLAGSPSRVAGVSTLPLQRRGEVLQGDEEEVVRRLVQNLRELAVL